MPWHIEERDGRFCVIKDDDGDNAGCHDSRDQAEAQMRALYANEPEARVAALDGEREIRSATFQPIDVADDGSSFEGYAAVFDELATFDLPGVGTVTEEVRRGAFRKALGTGENVPMLYHHLEVHPPLATTRGGTLQLEEDAKGLRVRARIANTNIGNDVRELVKRGDIPGMSWGFIAGRGNSQVERRGNGVHRTLTGFKKILDVSPTWDPTYRGTEAQFRAQAFGLAFTSDEMQQLLLGGPPAEGEQGGSVAEEDAETRSAGRESDESGAAVPVRTIAARKRALDLFIYETGGDP